MADSRRGRRCAITVAVAGPVVVALVLAACGGDDRMQRDTELRRSLTAVGTAVSPAGTGFGWVDVARVRDESGAAAVVADAAALGPGGDQLFAEARRVARGTGINPLAAEQALSLSGSYTFAIRLDGTSPGRLPAQLRSAGARRSEIGGSTGFDLGEPAQAVLTGPLSSLDAFASRTAVGDGFVVLSRLDGPRASLAGEGESVLDNEWLDVATACLGEVSAARTFPGGFAHNPAASPDLFAIGARAPDETARREVMCTIDDSADDAEARAGAMERSFAPQARDAVTDKPMRQLVDGAEIETLDDGDLHAARAELTLTRKARRGLLFEALGRGSLATYAGSPAPLPD